MEDDPIQARLLQRRMRRVGFAVDLAPDGKIGLDMLDRHHYDLILVDNQMPHLDGMEVMARLTHLDRCPPIIMVTAMRDAEVAVQAMKLGASDFIIKDTDGIYLSLLPTVIREVLYRRSLIAEKRLYEEALRRREQRFRHLVQNIGDVILILSEQGEILYVSPAAKTLLGVPAETLTGRTFTTLVHPDDMSRAAVLMQTALSGTTADKVDTFRLRHQNGHWTHVATRCTNLLDEPSINGLVMVLRDDTERIAYTRVLEEAHREAEETNKLKTRILANMSHEVRTPLSAIIGFAHTLEEHVEGEAEEFIQLIQSSAYRLLNTLNSVLDASRLQSGAVQPHVSRFHLQERVLETFAMLKPLAETKGLTLTMDLPEEPTFVYLDAGFLDRILTNLISNAIKFTNVGDVRLGLTLSDTQLHFEISDTGIGIDAEFLPQLFNQFSQERAGMNRSHQGSGLGLYIVHQLLEQMGGHISVTSTKGEGTTFHVTLPRT